ncbi:MAG TPA: ABC transporter permease subunit, partial [Anaerolineales bacterium]|nr:ABC transporter permease subunit [Anaerolineales bacterium]
MRASQDLMMTNSVRSTSARGRHFMSAVRYLAGKALIIGIAIFSGVFITVLIVNQTFGRFSIDASPFELRLLSQIDLFIQINVYNGTISRDAHGVPDQKEVEALTEQLRDEAGLNLPFLPRYLLWTKKALTFDWGRLTVTRVAEAGAFGEKVNSGTRTIVLQFLPNTLLLVGTAYLLVFLIGMPLSLYLARNYGNWLDRFLAFLSPISSVPSWVFALLLITIFAVQLHWLPAGKMFDFHAPENPIQYALELARHMVLPVIAIVLSLLFQIIYTWRTFFIIYSEEDYVELARAKGLPDKTLEQQHILKPALPYVLTSFATTLIGFWQLTVVLEKVFQWPGMGWLYIEVLPSYWKDAPKVGDLMIVIQIVVTFAYILGILVFILDIVYVIVDPRIHLTSANDTRRGRTKVAGWSLPRKALMRRKSPGLVQPAKGLDMKRPFSWDRFLSGGREAMRNLYARSHLFFQELRRYPSALLGLAVIAVLLTGSIYAVTALPYEQYGRDYDENRVTGRNLLPRVAAPEWLNIFSATPRLSRLVLDENSPEVSTSIQRLESGWLEKTTTFKIEYPYKDIPSDIFLYLDPQYAQKIPFVSLVWTTPDGRLIQLKAKSVSGDLNYDFASGIPVTALLNKNPKWKNWFIPGGQYPTPAYKLLFARPGMAQAIPQTGTYRLEVKSLFFEEGSDLHAQLVILGGVYGLAGTDYWRRDLIVPLLWGMPFTLIIGFLGTLVTTLIALLLPAIGVWFGGWLDSLIQRLTEVNMVLPGLAIVVLINAIYGVHIWILLAIVVLLNALGAPIKTFRSALLQAKEAPYIEMARSYGASNLRIITQYLVPRILPVLIPQLVAQVPSFIFLEATLGFFNIKSDYPSWGRIIYEGLARGALYGSPFWVLEPISLLLLTGFAFAMLGAALERILNPRIMTDLPVTGGKTKSQAERQQRKGMQSKFDTRVVVSLALGLLLIAILIPLIRGKTFAGDPPGKSNTRIKQPSTVVTNRPYLTTPSA